MPKLVNFLEKSVQWIALGLAGVFLLLCVYWYLLTPPATKKVGGIVVTPTEIDEMTQKVAAAIAADIKNAQPDQIKVADFIGPWKAQMGSPASKVHLVLGPLGPFQTVTGGSETVQQSPNGNPTLVTAVATLPKATPLLAQTGMSVVAPLPDPSGKAVQGTAAFDVLWASAAFSISGKDLQAAFAAPLKDKPANLATFYRTAYLHVELQRQQATGHDGNGTPIFPDGDTGVETVEIAKVDQNDIQPLPSRTAPRDTKASFAQWAQSNEMNIREPKFYTIQAGSPFTTPVLPGQAGTPAAGAVAAPRVVMATPANPGGANANNGKEVGIDPLTLTDDQLVWSHDDTVKPGRSYRYRIVYHMMNPVFALVNIADPKILDQLDIASPPSDWSTPVTIPLNVQYWVTSLQHGGTSALFDVFKWELGNWKRATLSLAPGDTVPGTDQTLVDVHTNPSGHQQRDQYVLLTDASGEAIRHVPGDDRSNATYKDLLTKTNPANPAGGAPPPQARTPAGRTGLMPTR